MEDYYIDSDIIEIRTKFAQIYFWIDSASRVAREPQSHLYILSGSRRADPHWAVPRRLGADRGRERAKGADRGRQRPIEANRVAPPLMKYALRKQENN